MKKIMFITAILSALLLAPITCFGQDERLKFRDIEIDGSLTSFVEKMKKIGYVHFQTSEGQYTVMNGNFIGQKCELFILATPKTATVWKVAVYLSEESSWRSLKSEYNSIKAQLTQKYGNPTDTFNFFSSPYYEGDGYELSAVKNDKCNYLSFWKLDNGTISLKIATSCQIMIAYEDDKNTKLSKKEKSERNLNDL